jgi:hypothetical protein
MSDFIQDLTSLHFWLAVILVGVTLEIIGHLLGKGLDKLLSNTFNWWRTRSEARTAKRQNLVSELRSDTNKQVMHLVKMATNFGLGMMLVLTSVLFLSPVLVHIALQGNKSPENPVSRQTVTLCLVSGLVLLFTGSAAFGMFFRGVGILFQAYQKPDEESS